MQMYEMHRYATPGHDDGTVLRHLKVYHVGLVQMFSGRFHSDSSFLHSQSDYYDCIYSLSD